MKKFKNRLTVYCENENLIQAFEKELKQLGWIFRDEFGWCSPSNHIVLDNPANRECNYANHNANLPTFNLPAHWNEALAAASEVEEEIPEYVEFLSGWDSLNTGKIFCTSEEFKVYPGWQGDWDWKFLLTATAHKNYFKPSTKAAYEAQQQELADKEVLERLIRESGFKIGDVVYCNYKNIYTTDKQQFSGSTVSNRKIRGFKLINGNLAFILEGDVTYYFWCKDVIKLPQSKTLTLGSSNIEIKISKGKIEANGRMVDDEELTTLIASMRGLNEISGWDITYNTVKIGCSTFTVAELEQIVETYNELNK